MKKIIIFSLLACGAYNAMAQETYESAAIATEDLNGTARYVGMGGAMEALGADISTIGTNPAGIGMFRSSWAGGTLGVVSQPKQDGLANSGKTAMSFDQLGFVVSTQYSSSSFVNVGFNYKKSRNFNQVIAATGGLNHASQNKSAYLKFLRENVVKGGYYPDLGKDGYVYGYENENSDYVANNYSVSDYLLYNSFITVGDCDYFCYNEAAGFDFNRKQKGYIGEYSINLSGNSKNRFYWGLTAGIHDVHYDGTSEYTERLLDWEDHAIGTLTMLDNRKITGQGYDIKGGVIIRPIEDSPFRFGVSVASPTWYKLKSSNTTVFLNDTRSYDDGSLVGYDSSNEMSESHEYKMNTPWKFGLSLGHTVGRTCALGVSYEFADYSSIDNRQITNSYYDDYYGSYRDDSRSDDVMNRHTEESLKGVHTLKVGMEYKLAPELAVRLGYNYVSPMYKTNAVRDLTIDSPGVFYSSTTDYTNWKDTQRVTVGLGYTMDNVTVDLAYVYNTQKGDFYPFQSGSAYDSENNYTEVNKVAPTSVKNDRHQFLMTIGVRL